MQCVGLCAPGASAQLAGGNGRQRPGGQASAAGYLPNAAPRPAPARHAARSPLRRARGPDKPVPAAVPPSAGAMSVTDAEPAAATAPGLAPKLQQRAEASDAARRRLEEHWAQPSSSEPSEASTISAIIRRPAAPRRARAAAAVDAAADLGDSSTVRRAPLTVRGQRLCARRTLQEAQRALSLSRATTRRAGFEAHKPTQRPPQANGRPALSEHAQVLTREEEVLLITRAQTANALELVADELHGKLNAAPTLDQLACHTGLTLEMVQQRLLFGRQARQLMLERNVRLVHLVARRCQGGSLTISDLVEEGTQGLLRSIDKFDVTKGFKFSTYAYFWIRQSVSRAVHDQCRSVRIPVYVQEQLTKIRKITAELRDARGEEPTSHEVGKLVGLSAERVARLLELSRDVSKLEAPVMGDSGKGDDVLGTLDEFLAPDEPELDEHSLEEQHLVDDVNALLNTLEPRERNVLRMHYGLAITQHGRSMTRFDVGSTYGISCERVRQIEENAMRKLREPTRLGALAARPTL